MAAPLAALLKMSPVINAAAALSTHIPFTSPTLVVGIIPPKEMAYKVALSASVGFAFKKVKVYLSQQAFATLHSELALQVGMVGVAMSCRA